MRNRRQFLRNLLLAGAGFGLQVPIFDLAMGQGVPPPAELVVVTGREYDRLVRMVVDKLAGIGRFVRSGDRVVIKPNIGWDRSVEQGANTHPLVVKTLAEMALEGGAARVAIFDYTCNEKRRCYVNSGIQQAIESIGDRRVQLEHIDERKFVTIDIKNGKSLTKWEIYREAIDADVYINVPVAKHHGLSGLSLGLKNAMGVIGGRRGSLHFNLGQKLADLATVVRPTLTVIDATRMLLRNGPQGGSVDDVKIMDTLVGSVDPVAADAFATTLFGLEPSTVSSTVAAYQMGLGEMELAKMRIQRLSL